MPIRRRNNPTIRLTECANSALSPVLLFFFSSRRRHTRLTCDWSSDVCSSDLYETIYPSYYDLGRSATNIRSLLRWDKQKRRAWVAFESPLRDLPQHRWGLSVDRSEERRVGKECRCWWATYGKCGYVHYIHMNT